MAIYNINIKNKRGEFMETITIKQDYSLFILYDMLEMIRGTLCITYKDATIKRLFNELIDYLCLKMQVPEDCEAIDFYVAITREK